MGVVFLSITYRSGKQGDFLGQVALGLGDLDLRPCDSGRDLDLALQNRDRGQDRDQHLVQGTIQLRVKPLPAFEVYGWKERAKGSGCQPRRVERTDQQLTYLNYLRVHVNSLLLRPNQVIAQRVATSRVATSSRWTELGILRRPTDRANLIPLFA